MAQAEGLAEGLNIHVHKKLKSKHSKSKMLCTDNIVKWLVIRHIERNRTILQNYELNK